MSRRVYFAFHYQDVVDFRANVVRNHGALAGADKAGFYDASIWESAKKDSSLALKRMINSELQGTSVTAVLIGSQTFARTWVKYEIFKSLERGNKLLGIHINKVRGKDGTRKSAGPNPFQYLAVKRIAGTKYQCLEYFSGSWRVFPELEIVSPVKLSGFGLGRACVLASYGGIGVYDWIDDNGHANFANWIG